MITEMFIEGMAVDLSKEISALLTFAIDDITDFGSRNTSFSKTIVLPGTGRNNQLFGHIYDVKSGNFHDANLTNIGYNFNASKAAQARIFQGNIQAFKGVVRLLEIIIDNGNIEYEVAVFGELGGFANAMGAAKLENLDFSAYDHLWTSANIYNSWDNPGGSDYYYPLIDHGNYSSDKTSWQQGTFRPAFYVKEYIDKIFEAAGYSYTCALFNTSRFKSLIIPANVKKLQRIAAFSLDVDANYQVYNNASPGNDLIKFPNTVVMVDFTVNGLKDTFTYTGAGFNGTVNMNINGIFAKAAGGNITITLYKNATSIASVTFGAGIASGTFDELLTASVTLAASDTLTVEMPFVPGRTYTINDGQLKAGDSSITYVDLTGGEWLEVNNYLPKGYYQKDFIASIIKLFNLYIVEDPFNDKKLIITPYPDFIDPDPANAIDWSYKLDRSKPIKLKPLSEHNSRYYDFTFKSDSDYYNELYKKKYNEGYGDYVFDSGSEFSKNNNKVDVIFSSTPLVGYAGKDKVYPTIFKKTGSTEEQMDSNIRIMQTKKITGVASWAINPGGTTSTNYGYAGHLDDPDAPTNDLNFGAPQELYFSLLTGNISTNQFNVYWSGYMAEVTDKDSKLLTADFYLSAKDIYSLDFSKLIYLDGSYFRINKIEDYNASEPNTCRVTLLKVIYTIY